MACPCQTSSLRVVIRSLTQLSVAETRTNSQRLASTARGYSAQPTPPTPLSIVTFRHGHSRGFHSARAHSEQNPPEHHQQWSTDPDPFLGMPGYEGADVIAFPQPGPESGPASSSSTEDYASASQFTSTSAVAVSAPIEAAAEPQRIMTRPPASGPDEFVKRLKKALRKAKRTEQISVPFDPTDDKKKDMAAEHNEQVAFREKEEKTVAKLEAKKAAGEELGMEWWRKHKLAMKKKFPEGWSPRKKISPDAMEGIRVLHQQFPGTYTTPVLAARFGISAEAVRRILRSNWRQKEASAAAAATGSGGVSSEEIAARWTERGMRVWTQMAAFGVNPPRKWEKLGIERDMLQVGQRDAQEGNRRGRYWKERVEIMKEQHSDRFRRQQQWQGAQQEHYNKHRKPGAGVAANVSPRDPPIPRDRVRPMDNGDGDDGLGDEATGLSERLSNTL